MNDEPRYCAPIDFGAWHITVDGKTTACGQYSVEQHHISGTLDEYQPDTDCRACAVEQGLITDE